MAKSARMLAPNVETKPKKEVLRALGIDPKRVQSYGPYEANMTIVESWQVSPHYPLEWMVNLGDELGKDDCPVYGVEVKPIDRDR